MLTRTEIDAARESAQRAYNEAIEAFVNLAVQELVLELDEMLEHGELPRPARYVVLDEWDQDYSGARIVVDVLDDDDESILPDTSSVQTELLDLDKRSEIYFIGYLDTGAEPERLDIHLIREAFARTDD